MSIESKAFDYVIGKNNVLKVVSLEDAQKEIEEVKTNEDKLAQALIEQRDRALENLEAARIILEKLLKDARPLNYYTKNGDIRYTMRQDYKWLSEYDLADLKECLADKPKSEGE